MVVVGVERHFRVPLWVKLKLVFQTGGRPPKKDNNNTTFLGCDSIDINLVSSKFDGLYI